MSSSGEIYGMHIMPDRFNADILLPNGLFMSIPCKREDTLEQVKRQLWKAINNSTTRYFDIGDQTLFIFSAVTLDAELEEFYEESRRLCDLRLFDYILKLVEPAGNKEEQRVKSMIDLAIGKKINELFLELPRELKEEIQDFRSSRADNENIIMNEIEQGNLYSSYSSIVDVPFKMRIISATYVNVRNIDSVSVKAAVCHGNDFLGLKTTSPVDPSNPKWNEWLEYDFHFTDLPRNAKICLSIDILSKKRGKEACSLCCGTMTLFDYRGFLRSGRAQLELSPPPTVLDETQFPFGAFHTNPNSDSTCLSIEFWSFDRHVVFAPIRDVYTYASHVIKQEPSIANKTIKIPTSTYLPQNVNNSHVNYSSIKLDFRDRTLSNSCADTKAFIERRLSSSSNQRRDSVNAAYNDPVIGLIRSRRPTVTSDRFSASSSRTSSTSSIRLARLDSNSAKSANDTSVTLTNLSLDSGNPIQSISQLSPESESSSQTPTLKSSDHSENKPDSPASPEPTSSEEEDIKLVNELIASPPFTPLTDKQKNLIWSMRFYCKQIPESLPKILDVIDWKSRNQISQLYVLLDEWGQVSLETALRLLDLKYEDSRVRKFAIKWLDGLLDEEMLSCYLLQFVQVLKTEPYIDNEISRFLNKRVLDNDSIGNLYFWYLKSECDEDVDYHNTIRFRYLLEKYLGSISIDKLVILTKQVQGLDKLKNLAEALRFKSKDDRVKFMQGQLQRVDFLEMLQDIPDPTNNHRFLGNLLYDQCRIMDSAKRPLWLVWTLPILNDEQAKIYDLNPKSHEDIISLLPRCSRSYSYSYEAVKELQTKSGGLKLLRKSIKEDPCSMSLDVPDLAGPATTSRFNSRTMTSSSDSAKNDITATFNSSQVLKTSSISSMGGQNGCPIATSAIIFKIGDDLRQDMLTLQIIRIVDTIWRREGLDMCMLAYTCLATDKNVGIIEVVNRAETITSIQRSGGKMAAIQIDSTQLHRWIKDRNDGPAYDEAIEKFTRSCAGFSVLTFVLGIADRNPDNIMVSEDGRIFHIDFGHFLGHFKKKFGINRERVPFVLTEDFLQVISRGSDVSKNIELDRFKQLCTDAYFKLRKHSNLLITLFTMMLRTGIPELRSLEDISYLKTSLQVEVPESKAREFFEVQFLEAYCGAWATKVDWFFHNIKRM